MIFVREISFIYFIFFLSKVEKSSFVLFTPTHQYYSFSNLFFLHIWEYFCSHLGVFLYTFGGSFVHIWGYFCTHLGVFLYTFGGNFVHIWGYFCTHLGGGVKRFLPSPWAILYTTLPKILQDFYLLSSF